MGKKKTSKPSKSKANPKTSKARASKPKAKKKRASKRAKGDGRGRSAGSRKTQFSGEPGPGRPPGSQDLYAVLRDSLRGISDMPELEGLITNIRTRALKDAAKGKPALLAALTNILVAEQKQAQLEDEAVERDYNPLEHLPTVVLKDLAGLRQDFDKQFVILKKCREDWEYCKRLDARLQVIVRAHEVADEKLRQAHELLNAKVLADSDAKRARKLDRKRKRTDGVRHTVHLGGGGDEAPKEEIPWPYPYRKGSQADLERQRKEREIEDRLDARLRKVTGVE